MEIDQARHVFQVLGPVQVAPAGRPLEFARHKQRELLAYLILHVGQVLSPDRIVDAMWGDAVPETARKQINNMMSGLRTALLHDGRVLATVDRQHAGYRLQIVTGTVDLAEFTALVERARAASSPRAAAGLLRQALDIWQGDFALGGVDAPFAAPARVRLQEQREAAMEALFEAELACGNHAAAVGELAAAVDAYPGRERLVAQLMLALYRGGRAPEALTAFRRARQRLADEFGLEPGRELQSLHQSILRGDPALLPASPEPQQETEPNPRADTSSPAEPPAVPGPNVAPSGATQPAPAPRPRRGAPSGLPVPAQLPPALRGFVGRATELATLDSAAQDSEGTVVISALLGMAGVGKTALAVHWAHRVADRFPDGQLYVNLRGFGPTGPPLSAAEAVRGFLAAFGFPPDRAPDDVEEEAALYRSLLARRRVLVLLDNAATADQIRPLLPGSPGCLVVVTSRSQLIGLVAEVNAVPVALDPLAEAEARQVMAQRLGAERVAAEPQAVEDLIGRCARLPLALSLLAARAAARPTFPLASFADELREPPELMDETALPGEAAGDGVRTVFSWSYLRLSAAAARLFRLLGVHPDPHLGAPAAASLAGLPLAGVRRQLTELVDAHLVTEPAPGRFVLHDLLWAYAKDLAHRIDSDEERTAALGRLLDHYLHTAHAAAALLETRPVKPLPTTARPPVEPDELIDVASATGWLMAERRVLVCCIDAAAESGFDWHAGQLAQTVSLFLSRQGYWHDWLRSQHTALECARRQGDRSAQAQAHRAIGRANRVLGRYGEAHHHLGQALDVFCALGNLTEQAHLCLNVAVVLEREGRIAECLARAQRSLELYRKVGDVIGQGQALNSMGWCHSRLGDQEQALVHCQRALELGMADRHGTADTWHSIGYIHHQRGDLEAAVDAYARAVALYRELGVRYHEAATLQHLGDAIDATGDGAGAIDAWRRALRILDDLAHPEAEEIRARLATAATSRSDDPSPLMSLGG